jgi:hypothetical protein
METFIAAILKRLTPVDWLLLAVVACAFIYEIINELSLLL